MKKFLNGISFREVFILPLALLIIIAILLTWYISYSNSKNAVNNLIKVFHNQTSSLVTQHLKTYMSAPLIVNRININAIELGQLEPENFGSSKKHFISQIKLFKEIIASGFANEQKEYISSAGNVKNIKVGYAISSKINNYTFQVFSEDSLNKYKMLQSYPKYNPLNRPWYKKARNAGKQVWTEPYIYTGGEIIGIDNVIPLFKNDIPSGNLLKGVLFTSLSLSEIGDFIKRIDLSPNGKIFIIDRKGMIIANSSPKNKNHLLYISESGDPIMKDAVHFLISKFGSLSSITGDFLYDFKTSEEKHVAKVVPYKDKYGLEWLVFTVIPEKDFMEQISQGNQNAVFLIFIFMFLFLIIATAVIFIVTSPLIQLKDIAVEIAGGNLAKRVQIYRNDEIGDLANSFNNMADKLQSSFESLKSSEEKFRKLFDISPLSTLIIDSETNEIVLANKASEKNFGYTFREIIGKNIAELNLINKTERDKILDCVNKSGKAENIETFFTSKSGRRIESLVYLIPVEIGGKEINIGMSLDISKLKKTEEELRKLNDELDLRVKLRTSEIESVNLDLMKEIEIRKNAQAKLIQSEKMASLGVLAAGIAHEINNPINYINASINAINGIINNFIQVIQKYDNLNQENISEEIRQFDALKNEIDFSELIRDLSELSKNITMGVKRTAEIIKALMTFSHPDKDEKSNFDINHNIEIALTLLENQYDKISIRENLGKIRKITGYPGKINQVIINLLTNAKDSIINKKELSDNEVIFISTSLREKNGKNYVLTEIKDTGEGIPPDLYNRIFEPFFTTKEVGKGTGLGLAISMNIIEEHNGVIEFESQLGEGSVFKIYLPAD